MAKTWGRKVDVKFLFLMLLGHYGDFNTLNTLKMKQNCQYSVKKTRINNARSSSSKHSIVSH